MLFAAIEILAVVVADSLAEPVLGSFLDLLASLDAFRWRCLDLLLESPAALA